MAMIISENLSESKQKVIDIMFSNVASSTQIKKIQSILNEEIANGDEISPLLINNEEYLSLAKIFNDEIERNSNEQTNKISDIEEKASIEIEELNKKIDAIDTEKIEKVNTINSEINIKNDNLQSEFEDNKNKLLKTLIGDEIKIEESLLDFVNNADIVKYSKFGQKNPDYVFEYTIEEEPIKKPRDDKDLEDLRITRTNDGLEAIGTQFGMPNDISSLRMNKTHLLRSYLILKGGFSQQAIKNITGAPINMVTRLAGQMFNNPRLGLLTNKTEVTQTGTKMTNGWNKISGEVDRTPKGDAFLAGLEKFIIKGKGGNPEFMNKCKIILPTVEEAEDHNKLWDYPEQGGRIGVYAENGKYNRPEVKDWKLKQERIDINKLRKMRDDNRSCKDNIWVTKQWDEPLFKEQKDNSVKLRGENKIII